MAREAGRAVATSKVAQTDLTLDKIVDYWASKTQCSASDKACGAERVR
jgi:hypothetical protein